MNHMSPLFLFTTSYEKYSKLRKKECPISRSGKLPLRRDQLHIEVIAVGTVFMMNYDEKSCVKSQNNF